MSQKKNTLNVMLIEDNDQHAKIVTRHLSRNQQLSIVRRAKLAEGLDYIAKDGIDVILLDLRLPDSEIDETLDTTLKACPYLPIVVLSSMEDQAFAQSLVQKGAQDYLCKNQLSEELLTRAIYYARERKHAERLLRLEVKLKHHINSISELAIVERNINRFLTQAVAVIRDALDVEIVGVLRDPGQGRHFSVRFISDNNENGLTGMEIDTSELLREQDKIFVDNGSVYRIWGDKSYGTLGVPSVLEHLNLQPGIGAAIPWQPSGHPYGLLAAYPKSNRIFCKEEQFFIMSAVNIISAALQRFSLDSQLRQKIQDLNIAHQRKDEFLSILSHELRTPLGVIMGYADLIGDFDPASVDFQVAIDAIRRNATAELRLVEDILEESRIITGRFRLQATEFPFSRVFEGALSTVKLAADAKGIKITSLISDSLGSVKGDEGRLQQVLWNLLSNAVRFTPRDGQISIEARTDGLDHVFTVSDNGEGIEPENIPHVFDRFWQGDSSLTRKHGGLGLGLSIVKHIVEAHGGSISCSSAGKDRGTTFEVRLPTNPEAVKSTAQTPQEDNEAITLPWDTLIDKPLEGFYIAILANPDVHLLTWFDALKKEGAVVEQFSSHAETLKHLAGNPLKYDVLIADQDCLLTRPVNFADAVRAIMPKLLIMIVKSENNIASSSGEISRKFVHIERTALASELVGSIYRQLTSPA